MTRATVNLGGLIPFLCTVLAAGAAPAQRDVLRVAPSGAPYQQITDAIAAAAPGDTIRVAAGTYLPFTLTFGLTIEAESGPMPLIEGYSFVRDIVPGQVVALAGLYFRSRPWTPATGDDHALVLSSRGGTIALVSSRVESGPLAQRPGVGLPRPGAACVTVAESGGVLMLNAVDCIGRSSTDGLRVGWAGGGVGEGVVIVQGGTCRGGDADCVFPCSATTPPGVGIYTGGFSPTSRQALYLSDVQVQGGNVVPSGLEPYGGAGLRVGGNVLVFIRAGTHTIRGGQGGYQRGGDGVYLDNSSGVFHDGFPFVGGLANGGGGSPGSPVGGIGQLVLVPRLLSQLSFDTAMFDRLVPTTLTITARPSEFHFLVLAFDAGWLQLPGILEPIHVFSTPNWLQYGFLVMNAQGTAQTQVLVPGDVNLIGLPLWFQSFGYDPSQLVVGPLAGSVIR